MTEKKTENVRVCALTFQQLVEKGLLTDSAATINLKCSEILTQVLPQKKLNDFAHKRKIKHTPTLMEPPVAFHTLVKIVDTEDITKKSVLLSYKWKLIM